ncbi:MAG: polysaccharide deacetylase family protein [Candidatus Magasanikbacteria bacterium]
MEAEKNKGEEKMNFVQIEEEFYLPILCFHHVGESPRGASEETKNWYVSKNKFESILEYLQEKNYNTLFASDLLQYMEEEKLPENSILLTFDDGSKTFYTNVYPLLKKYNMKAVMHIMSGVKGNLWLSTEEIQEMEKSGLVEFQSHTEYHAYLTRISDTEIKRELERSKKILEEITQKPVEFIAYPFGLYDERVMRIAKEVGYKGGFTIKRKHTQKKNDPMQLHRTIIMESMDIADILKKP